jgi:hypothetical protein
MPRYDLDVTSTVGFLAAENQLQLIQKGARCWPKMAGWRGLPMKRVRRLEICSDTSRTSERFTSTRCTLMPLRNGQPCQKLYLRDTQLEMDALSSES